MLNFICSVFSLYYHYLKYALMLLLFILWNVAEYPRCKCYQQSFSCHHHLPPLQCRFFCLSLFFFDYQTGSVIDGLDPQLFRIRSRWRSRPRCDHIRRALLVWINWNLIFPRTRAEWFPGKRRLEGVVNTLLSQSFRSILRRSKCMRVAPTQTPSVGSALHAPLHIHTPLTNTLVPCIMPLESCHPSFLIISSI